MEDVDDGDCLHPSAQVALLVRNTYCESHFNNTNN